MVAQTVKCLPTVQDTWVRFLGWEDALEKVMAPHSSTLAWRIPWMEEPGRLQSMGLQRVGHDWATSLSLYCVLSIQYIPYSVFHLHDLFYNWKFVPLNLLHLFHHPLTCLFPGNHLFVLYIYESALVQFSNFTYSWNHKIVVFLYLTYFT